MVKDLFCTNRKVTDLMSQLLFWKKKVPSALRQGGKEIHSYNLIKHIFETKIIISFGSSLIIN